MSNAAPRNALKRLLKSIVLPSLCLLGFLAMSSRANADYISFDTYAAVAYSPSTGHYGYGWNFWSRGQAEQVALSNCAGKDAKIVGWVRGGWLVLAVGHDNSYGIAWEYGDGANAGVAAQRAINNCHSNGGKVVTIVRVCSGNINPVVIK